MSQDGSETNRPNLIIPPGIRKRLLFLLAWYPVGLLMFFLAAGLAQGLPSRLMNSEEWLWQKQLVLAFLFSSLLPGIIALLGGKLRAWQVWGLTAAVFGGVWYLAGIQSQAMPVIGLVLLSALLNLYLPAAAQGRWRALLPPAGLAALMTLCSLPGALEYTPAKQLYYGYRLPQQEVLNTTAHSVQYQLFRAALPVPEVAGGGLFAVNNTAVVVTGGGEFYRLDFSPEGNRLTTEPLDYQVPVNTAAFRKQGFEYRKFRVHGVLLLAAGDSGLLQVLVTHHYFHEAENCTTLRVSSFSALPDEFLSGRADSRWRTLYETRPCLPLEVNGNRFFAGHQAGGRILQKNATKILVSVGDHAYDGVNLPHAAPQDRDNDYGKILEIDTVDGSRHIYSLGLRNPQGLYRDTNGHVWVTDHGPKGGDELNLVEEGGNYGWPLETWGANYGHFTWPLQGTKPTGMKFTPPVFSWLPSIGISNLIGIEHGVFDRWQGDLIIGSLIAQSIYRVHLDGVHPVFSEPIYLGQRIRDLTLDARGRIVLWMDDGLIGLLTPLPDPDRIH
jgi:hypothetical protein